MMSFRGMTPAELAELPDAIEPLTAVELRSVLLTLRGDTFAPCSMYDVALNTALDKMDRMLDDVQVKILRGRRGLTADTAGE